MANARIYNKTIVNLKTTFFDVFSAQINELSVLPPEEASKRIALLNKTMNDLNMIFEDVAILNNINVHAINRENVSKQVPKLNKSFNVGGDNNKSVKFKTYFDDVLNKNKKEEKTKKKDSTATVTSEKEEASPKNSHVLSPKITDIFAESENNKEASKSVKEPETEKTLETEPANEDATSKVTNILNDNSIATKDAKNNGLGSVVVPVVSKVDLFNDSNLDSSKKFTKVGADDPKAILVSLDQFNNLYNSRASQKSLLDAAPAVDEMNAEQLVSYGQELYKEGKKEEAQTVFDKVSQLNNSNNNSNEMVLTKKAA